MASSASQNPTLEDSMAILLPQDQDTPAARREIALGTPAIHAKATYCNDLAAADNVLESEGRTHSLAELFTFPRGAGANGHLPRD